MFSRGGGGGAVNLVQSDVVSLMGIKFQWALLRKSIDARFRF